MAAMVRSKPARQVVIVSGDTAGVARHLARRVQQYAEKRGAYKSKLPAPYRAKAGNWCVWLEIVGASWIGIGQSCGISCVGS